MIYKQPRQDLDLCGNSFARYLEKRSTQIFLFCKMMTSHENQEYFHGLERNPYETSDVYFIRHDKSSADDDRMFE